MLFYIMPVLMQLYTHIPISIIYSIEFPIVNDILYMIQAKYENLNSAEVNQCLNSINYTKYN